MKVKTWIQKHHRIFYCGGGIAIGFYLCHKYKKVNYDFLLARHNELIEAAEAPDKYANKMAKQIVSDILDCAYGDIIDNDYSDEQIASQLATDVLSKWENNEEIRKKAGELIKHAKDTLIDVYDIPEGKYGEIEIRHF